MKREECKNDLAELSRQMKIADLKPEIKNGLYSFFIEPEATSSEAGIRAYLENDSF